MLFNRGEIFEFAVGIGPMRPGVRVLGSTMVPALLMFGTASVAFGGHPWIAFVGGAALLFAYCAPDSVQVLKQYKGEPKTDIVFKILWTMAAMLAGAMASAWIGYSARLILRFFLRAQ
jgi:hypothetical protein